MNEIPKADEQFLRAALHAAKVARSFLGFMEIASERLAPERLPDLAAEARDVYAANLDDCAEALQTAPVPDELRSFAERLIDTVQHTRMACSLLGQVESVAPFEQIPTVLSALHRAARAHEGFYMLRRALPPFEHYWEIPGMAVIDGPPQVDSEGHATTGVIHISAGGHHGGFSLYVPEHYDPERRWPLIVALHGGSGNGRDFLWTWVREAKSYGYLLVAPSATGNTWGAVEDTGLLEILGWVKARYHLDTERILLTGLSDGATFGLLYGLAHPKVYRAIAPLCGVFHPAHESLGNLERAAEADIYLVHGRLDFLFPVEMARFSRDTLSAAGARVTYRELDDLSHTYPRSENRLILDWFGKLPARVVEPRG